MKKHFGKLFVKKKEETLMYESEYNTHIQHTPVYTEESRE